MTIKRVRNDRVNYGLNGSSTVSIFATNTYKCEKSQLLCLKQRTDIIKKTSWLSRISNTVMLFAVPAILATGAYSFLKICVIIISISTLIGLFTHLITLEVEIDASFNRAMPILQEKIPHMYHDACKSVLKAAAFTYVASVFANVFSFRYLWLLLTRAV